MADEDDAAPTNKSDADFPFVQLAYDVKSAEISPHPTFYWPPEIERIELPTPLEFYREYWDLDYLRTKAGALNISADLTPSGHGDCVIENEHGKLFVKPYQHQIRFGDYIDIVKKRKVFNGVYYIQKQNDNFRKEFKILHNDVPSNIEEWGTEVFGAGPDAVNLWMGDSRAVSSMHKDFYENLYCVIRGQKIFTLLPPSDLSFLEYKDCKAATYKYHTDRDDFTIELDDPAETIPWFDVDPDSPNVEQNPRLKNLNALQVTVNEGEMLYLPSLNFHKVSQRQDFEGKVLAINYWFDMKFDIKYTYFKFLEAVASSRNAQPTSK